MAINAASLAVYRIIAPPSLKNNLTAKILGALKEAKNAAYDGHQAVALAYFRRVGVYLRMAPEKHRKLDELRQKAFMESTHVLLYWAYFLHPDEKLAHAVNVGHRRESLLELMNLALHYNSSIGPAQ